METNRLKYFVTLAREGSFGRAAERLYVSQPALSQQVQKLESDLGVSLIDRTKRPWQLTPVGRSVLEHAKRVLNELQDLHTLIDAADAGEIGRIRFGIVPTALYGRVPTALRSYDREHPDVDVSVEVFNTTTLLTMLKDTRIDIGIVLSEYSDSQLQCMPLYSTEMLMAMPREHPLAARTEVRLRDFRDESFCMTARSSASPNHDQIVAACVAEGFSPRVSLERGSYAEQVGLVASGMGVAVVPSEVTLLHADSVIFRPVSGTSLVAKTTLIWQQDSTNAACRAFLRSEQVQSLRSMSA